jgi:hypothetical protein
MRKRAERVKQAQELQQRKTQERETEAARRLLELAEKQRERKSAVQKAMLLSRRLDTTLLHLRQLNEAYQPISDGSRRNSVDSSTARPFPLADAISHASESHHSPFNDVHIPYPQFPANSARNFPSRPMTPSNLSRRQSVDLCDQPPRTDSVVPPMHSRWAQVIHLATRILRLYLADPTYLARYCFRVRPCFCCVRVLLGSRWHSSKRSGRQRDDAVRLEFWLEPCLKWAQARCRPSQPCV